MTNRSEGNSTGESVDTAPSFPFGQPSLTADSFQAHRVSTRPHAQIVKALQAAIADAGLKLLYEIDVRAALANAGHRVLGARLMFYFHPDLVQRVLRTDWTAMVEAPLKFLVIEQPDGTTTVRWADPAVSFSRYGHLALAEFGHELSSIADRVVDRSLSALS